jgi:protein kinase-like protein
MEFAHQQEIVHRDLKPENILCDADLKSVVVADFGIAHFSADLLVAAVETSANERLANFTYSAPEQRTRGQSVGPPADIWALGLIVNELFTREIPLGRDHRLISSISPEYARLDQIVDQMLQQSPEARPAASILKSHFFQPPPNDVSSDAAPITLAPTGLDSGSELHLSSPAKLRMNIKQHESMPGLIFTVTNRRTKNIQECRVRVREAQSFDAEVFEYREALVPKIPELGRQKGLLAGDETGPYWLLAVRNGRLELGNASGEGGLRWPAGDTNDTQVWRLGLSVEAQDIEAWAAAVTVEWEQATNTLKIREDSDYAAAPAIPDLAEPVKEPGEKILAPERQEFWDQRKMLPETTRFSGW